MSGQLPFDPNSEQAKRKAARARSSALWAAYGDALGFIGELTDARGFKRRTGGKELNVPIPWARKIGGRSGPTVKLPAGTYSDDTQLRLATSRAIRSEGFDVEAFAKVELPVWLSYSLGGGRSTKAAATNLTRQGSTWFTNTYDGWTKAGGNGAAMRIQPHIWAATTLDDPRTYLVDVVRNTIVTHGDPVGLAGAAIHAVALAHILSTGEIPTPDEFASKTLAGCDAIPAVVTLDPEVGETWVSLWQQATGRNFTEVWNETMMDAKVVLNEASQELSRKRGGDGYSAVLHRLKLFDDARRGSALLTAIAAMVLVWSEQDPGKGLAIAASAVGSDTDTIATMAGALYGAANAAPPDAEIADYALISREADRMTAISLGTKVPHHRYPDLLRWVPPQKQADALIRSNSHLEVLGLGPVAEELGQPIKGPGSEFLWQWVGLHIGQTLLIKRRPSIPAKAPAPESPSSQQQRLGRGVATTLPKSMSRRSDMRTVPASTEKSRGTNEGADLDRAIQFLEQQKFSDEAIGRAVRRMAEIGTAEQLGFLAGIIRERLRKLQRP